MKTKEEIASAWAGIKLEIFTDTKDLKYIHPYITPKQCLRAMEAYKEEAVTELKQAAVMPSLPTDKEIETWATYECGGCSQESNDERIGLIRGAKWMRRQILKAHGNDR